MAQKIGPLPLAAAGGGLYNGAKGVGRVQFEGVVIGLCSFLIIGLFHPVVIKAEYHLSKKVWPLFLLCGCALIGASLFAPQHSPSAILGIAGFSCLWSIRELYEQEARVARGWFPKKKRETIPRPRQNHAN